MRHHRIFCLGLLLTLPFAAIAKISDHLPMCFSNDHLQKDQMVHDLKVIDGFFRVSYAPMLWKREFRGFNLKSAIALAEEKVMFDRNISTKKFHSIIKELCFSTADYHVVPEFYSTECSTLPFCIQGANGRYFISYIDETEIKNQELQVGDEILEFDKTDIKSLVKLIRENEVGHNYDPTDFALAELYLTMRLGSLGHHIPKGPLTLKILPIGKKKPINYKTEWIYYPELVKSASALHYSKAFRNVKTKRENLKRSYYKKEFAFPQFKAMKRYFADDELPSVMIGSKKSLFPILGNVIWQTEEDSDFYAYLFEMGDQKIGAYVRIPTYYEEEETAEQFFEVIKAIEKADVLVIDQLNNPGGSILYMYAILSALSEYPLEVPKHRIRITQEDVYFAALESAYLEHINFETIEGLFESIEKIEKELLSEYAQELEDLKNDNLKLEGLKVDTNILKGMQKSFKFIINEWEKGNSFTDAHYLFGIDKITPHKEIKFTKPILVLANSLSFSAGDFLPAIIQDNARGKIMGTRTAGAGGYVEQMSFPNLNGITGIDMTCSHSLRKSGLPIENLGVTPDIPYEVSEIDLQYNYREYAAKILEELKKMIDTP